ncbi:hypothetical protein LIER_32397 [Lithospermum erythrorhizon]|uniref:Uncharacterized protein n=1 Tax=Lithospermum erythrorhizon TaxID=34254 RepID=A0AAV3RUN6_LITER
MSSCSYKPTLPETPKEATSSMDEEHKRHSNNINVTVHSFPERKSTMFKTDITMVKKMETPIIRKLVKEPSQDIDQIAEAFIQRFRKQLHLQRLQSIENYEQMLKRGT